MSIALQTDCDSYAPAFYRGIKPAELCLKIALRLFTSGPDCFDLDSSLPLALPPSGWVRFWTINRTTSRRNGRQFSFAYPPEAFPRFSRRRSESPICSRREFCSFYAGIRGEIEEIIQRGCERAENIEADIFTSDLENNRISFFIINNKIEINEWKRKRTFMQLSVDINQRSMVVKIKK